MFVTRRGRLAETNRSNLTDLRSNQRWRSLQISLCTGKCSVATAKAGSVSREFVRKPCTRRSPSGCVHVTQSALKTFCLGTRRPRRRPKAISLSAPPGSHGGVARRGWAVRKAPTCRCTVHSPPAVRLHGPLPRRPRTSPPESPGQRGGSPHLRGLSGAGASQRSCG